MMCCTGINGSHTALCERTFMQPRLICWCCGADFPRGWAALQSVNGARCFSCEGHKQPCRRGAGNSIEVLRAMADLRDLPSTIRQMEGPVTDQQRTFRVKQPIGCGLVQVRGTRQEVVAGALLIHDGAKQVAAFAPGHWESVLDKDAQVEKEPDTVGAPVR